MIITDVPRNSKDEKPADNPNKNNSFLLNLNSNAFVVNKPVQNNIVSGFEIVSINADMKLPELLSGIARESKAFILLSNTDDNSDMPNTISTIPLIIPKIFLYF